MSLRFEAREQMLLELVEGKYMVWEGNKLYPAEISDECQPGHDGLVIETDGQGNDTIIRAIIQAAM